MPSTMPRSRSSSPSLEYNDKARWIVAARISHRRLLFATYVLLSLTALFTLAGFSFWTTHPTSQPVWSSSTFGFHSSLVSPSQTGGLDPLDPLTSLIGPPTQKFRDNLRGDVQYITSWISAGWTNDVMTYGNLIYLALITDRVPIVGMFTPSHVVFVSSSPVPSIAFGDVFDVPRLRKLLNKPVLEWREVKDLNSSEVEELGCWNSWETVHTGEVAPRGSGVPSQLNLDISYTKMPTWIKLIPNYEHDSHSTFWSLASFAFPETRAANLVPPRESPLHHVSLPPDEHILCYDYLYYTCAAHPFEYDMDFSPAWRYVVQHMRWTESLENLADSYVRQAINVQFGEPTPPWISIHIRHGDFANWCNDVPVVDCFASLDVIARRVREVQDELLDRKGLEVKHVIMTSDEKNSSWWDDVSSRGWLKIDHSKTMATHGGWYPVFIDAVIQSNGVGFVGTDRSTMTTLARRRVETWHDGVTRTHKWGKPDSDDH